MTQTTFMEFDLTPKEAGELLGITDETCRRWIKSGKLRAWTTPGGHYKLRRVDVLALLPHDDAVAASTGDAA